jgi:hypothetical protein
MVSGENQPSARPTGDTRAEIERLYKQCAGRENISQSEYGKLRDFLVLELSFPPLFPPAPKLDPIDLLIWQGHFYQTLISLLKKARDTVTFGYILAQWLRFERIREPKDFLPADVWRRLINDAEQRLQGFLQTDDYNAYLVRSWLPYTEPLLRKTKWLRDRKVRSLRAVLRGTGYDPVAVDLVVEKKNGWNSAVELTCGWLERRTSYKASTLRNSYSRVFGKSTLRKMKCSFCDSLPDGEFWVSGNPVLHCKAHRADRLPASEADALPDRVGARWWRENLDILCKVSPSR